MIKEYGYEYDATLDKQLWEQCKGKVTYQKMRNAICLRSGRDALKAIAREYEPTIVYMPALACDSMVLPFEMYGHKIVYYKLQKDYTIDFLYLDSVLEKGLFLYMDYFGIETISDEQLDNLKKKYQGLVFVEDRTHNFIWERNLRFQPDYMIASLRKWIAVPDGGLLWTKKALQKTNFSEDTTFSEMRQKAQCMRNEFFTTGDNDLKTEYRKIFSTVSEIIDKDEIPCRMSDYSYKIANAVDWQRIKIQRSENAACLISILKEYDIQLIQDEVGFSDLYVAFVVDQRDFKQSKLSQKGIFNTVIWPLNNEQKRICKVAKYTEEHMLAAPCDQRYSVKDMQFIGKEIVNTIMSERFYNEKENNDFGR